MSEPRRPSSHYTQIEVPVSAGRLDMAGRPRDQVIVFDVCNNCGAVVGNRPAHNVFCDTDYQDARGSSS